MTKPPEVGWYKPKYSQVERVSMKAVIRAPQKNLGTERILQRDLQHMQFCDHVLNVLNDKHHPKCRRGSHEKLTQSRASIGLESHTPHPQNTGNMLTSNNLLSLNLLSLPDNRAENAGTPALSRRGDNVEKKYHGKDSPSPDKGGGYTTVYNTKGQPVQKSSFNKESLQQFQVEHWQKFSSPVYNTEVTLESYHLVKDKDSARYYVQPNKVESTIGRKMQENTRGFEQQNKRK